MEISKIYSLKRSCVLLFILVLFCAYPTNGNGIVMAPGNVDHFDIVGSDVVVAGEPFTAKIIAKDKFDNTIINYDEIGTDVEIKVIGRGKIAPDTISASVFKDGAATIDFIYDRAETFTIIARTKLRPWFKPKVVSKKVIKAVKKGEVREIEVLEREIAAEPPLMRELDLATERLDEAIKVKSGLEERLIRLTKTLEESERQNLRLKATLSEIILDRANLKDQLAENRAILAQSEARLTELEDELTQLTKSLDEKDKENLSLKATLSEITMDRANLEDQLAENRAILAQSEARLAEIEDEVRRAADAKAKLTYLENRLKEVGDAKASLEERLIQLTDAKASLEERLIQLTKSLDEKDRESLSLKRRLEDAILQRQILDNQLASTRGFLTQTQVKLNQLRKLSSSLEDAFKGIELEEVGPREIVKKQPVGVGEEREERLLLDKYTVKIYSVGRKYVILPIGKKDGLRNGMTFTVYKDEEAVAEIKVTELYEDISMADIEKTIGKGKIRNGDIVSLR